GGQGREAYSVEAFTVRQAKSAFLCPLDYADDIPFLTFGPNTVRTFSSDDLENFVDAARLRRTSPFWTFDSRRFSQFTWLVIEYSAPIETEPGQRANPMLYFDLAQDFGAIEPHRRKFDSAVEDALLVLMLAPWEDWVSYANFEWRPF